LIPVRTNNAARRLYLEDIQRVIGEFPFRWRYVHKTMTLYYQQEQEDIFPELLLLKDIFNAMYNIRIRVRRV
jgi:hypothetical protein